MTVLQIATYVDEIALAGGGLLAKHAQAGDRVVAASLCYPGYPSSFVYPEVSAERPYGRFETRERYAEEIAQAEVAGVKAALGLSEVILFNEEGHTEALFGADIVDRVAGLINEYEPEVVVAHWPIGDYTDFIGAGSAVLRALIERRLKKMPQVYFCETLTGRHTVLFHPDTYVDIGSVIERKREACACLWQGQCVEYFFNPFALPIAHFRGRESGVAYAEAFATLHGSFGLEKQPHRQPTPAEARPRTMRRAVERLDRKQFVKGVYPAYESFDQHIAESAFGLDRHAPPRMESI